MACVGTGDVVAIAACGHLIKPINFYKKIHIRNRTMRTGLKATSVYEDTGRLNVHMARYSVADGRFSLRDSNTAALGDI